MGPPEKRGNDGIFSTPSPTSQNVQKKLQLSYSTPRSRLQPPPESVRPLYPTYQDKRNLVGVVDHFTRLSLEADLGDEKLEEGEYSSGENLVAKIELRKIEIVNGLDSLLSKLLEEGLGKNHVDFDFNACVAEAERLIAEKMANILDLDEIDPFKGTMAMMANFASKRILAELMASNLVPAGNDSSTKINEKRGYLKMTNPFRPMISYIIDDMLVQGVANRPSKVRSAGLMSQLNVTYNSIHNSLALTDKRLELMTNQIGSLTQTVTDQENAESHRMLVIRGLSEAIQTKESAGSQVRAQRELEAASYIRDTIGFKGPFSISLPPSKSKGPGIAILTVAFDQDKFRLERMISTARKGNLSSISSKRWTPADKIVSNLPSPDLLASQLKMGMKYKFNQQLTELKASSNEDKHELAKVIEATYSAAINNHDYRPRKQLYGKENSVQYEFLCPVSKGMMMIFKGNHTFDGYDFTAKHPNPRLRELADDKPELGAKHGFGS